MGATVIATSSSDEKLKVAQGLGARHLVNYRDKPEWADEALRLTGGKGVDLVIDVAGAGTVEQSLKALKKEGTAIMVGFLTKSKAADIVPALVFGAKTRKLALSLVVDFC